MIAFLFWNLHRNGQTAPLLREIVALQSVDVVVLTECPFDSLQLPAVLEPKAPAKFQIRQGLLNRRIVVAIRTPVQCLMPVAESRYLIVYPLSVPDRPELLLAAMHGISLLEADHIDLNDEAVIAAAMVRDAERSRGHSRTVLLGDFNLNPFDHGMAKATGFHAVMSRDVARDERRRVRFNDYAMFYNPMWSRFGDLSPGPPGTYFFDKAQHLRYYWNMYDQVLLRPSLLDFFPDDGIHVFDRIGPTDLLTNGVPDPLIASDHLPVLLRLDL